ncbi:hypothetical protein [Mycolicibacterium aromaticivorans]|uniref:hypothetical protein n=1 Tax=Mycolicibacterium aromaticivorans TaxID=318425 RepID=UPI0004BC0814|nr:hypothetical protein [Mycolicibacterium aromaticivorans]
MRVEAEVDMIVRVAVLFGDEFGFSIDELSRRRTDRSGPGTPIYWARNPDRDLTPCVGHAQSQECAGGSEMIQPDGKEKLPR